MFSICLSIHSDSFQIEKLADSNLTCNMCKISVWSLFVANVHLTNLYEKRFVCKTVLKILYILNKLTSELFFKCQICVLLTKFSLWHNFQQSGFIFNSFLVVGCRVFPSILLSDHSSVLVKHAICRAIFLTMYIVCGKAYRLMTIRLECVNAYFDSTLRHLL